MAIFSNDSNSYTLALKVFLISTGVLSMAMALKLSVPVISQFAVSELPMMYGLVISCLKPPYLYLVLNCIIVTIVASSKLQQNKNKLDYSPELVSAKITADLQTDFAASAAEAAYDGVVAAYDGVVSNKVEARPEFEYGYDDASVVKVEVVEPEDVYGGGVKGLEMTDGGDEFVISRSPWSTPLVRQDSVEFLGLSEQKPPVSARFGHRKAVKASPEAGKALRVSKPKHQDTLESTWKTITEGRAMPLTRHLRKSDTWETRHNSPQYQAITTTTTTTSPPKMKKSETFHDRTSTTNSSLLRKEPSLKKEPSLGQEELNRRVEAFINKFNEDMRLQRMESLNQYHEMIKRGAN